MEDDPHQRADRGTRPRAVLGGLLMLGHVHLAVVVLVHQRDVIGADQISRMQVKQRVVIGIGVITTRVHRRIHKHGVLVAHRPAPFPSIWSPAARRHRSRMRPTRAGPSLTMGPWPPVQRAYGPHPHPTSAKKDELRSRDIRDQPGRGGTPYGKGTPAGAPQDPVGRAASGPRLMTMRGRSGR